MSKGTERTGTKDPSQVLHLYQRIECMVQEALVYWDDFPYLEHGSSLLLTVPF